MAPAAKDIDVDIIKGLVIDNKLNLSLLTLFQSTPQLTKSNNVPAAFPV
jgi:hypothetical protein